MDFSFQNNYLQLKMLLMVKKKTILLGGGGQERLPNKPVRFYLITNNSGKLTPGLLNFVIVKSEENKISFHF